MLKLPMLALDKNTALVSSCLCPVILGWLLTLSLHGRAPPRIFFSKQKKNKREENLLVFTSTSRYRQVGSGEMSTQWLWDQLDWLSPIQLTPVLASAALVRPMQQSQPGPDPQAADQRRWERRRGTEVLRSYTEGQRLCVQCFKQGLVISVVRSFSGSSCHLKILPNICFYVLLTRTRCSTRTL